MDAKEQAIQKFKEWRKAGLIKTDEELQEMIDRVMEAKCVTTLKS